MSYAIEITKTGGPEVLRKTDLPVAAPGEGEVLIHNHAGAVNFIDTIIRHGEMPEGMMPELPIVPGVEGAGLIETIGGRWYDGDTDRETSWPDGDRLGQHGQYRLCASARRGADHINDYRNEDVI